MTATAITVTTDTGATATLTLTQPPVPQVSDERLRAIAWFADRAAGR